MIANFNHGGVSCLQTTKNKFYNLSGLIDYFDGLSGNDIGYFRKKNIVSIKEFDFSRQTLVRKIELR